LLADFSDIALTAPFIVEFPPFEKCHGVVQQQAQKRFFTPSFSFAKRSRQGPCPSSLTPVQYIPIKPIDIFKVYKKCSGQKMVIK
jgi:hypothetical protein